MSKNTNPNAVLMAQLAQLAAQVAQLTGTAPVKATAAPSFVTAARAAKATKAPAAEVSAFPTTAPAPCVAQAYEAHGHPGYSIFRVTPKGDLVPKKWVSQREVDAIVALVTKA